MRPVVVIPVFDEAATIAEVVTAAREHAPVIVVDDGSRDDGGARAARAGATVLRHGRRLGKAQALLSGVAAARRGRATHLVTLDGDGQHDAADIPALLEAVRQDERTVVVGHRIAERAALPAASSNAARLASFFAAWAAGVPVGDTQSGFRVYPVALFEHVSTRRGGFVFETEVLLTAARAGWTVTEVPVRVRPRAVQRSRFRPLRDGVAIGMFLAGPVLAAWAREAATGVEAMTAVFSVDRRRMRHAALLEAAAPYTDTPAQWALALGMASTRRLALRLETWRSAARRRGVPAAAVATALAPATLALLAAQSLAGPRLPDVLTPLVEAFYTPRLPGGGTGAVPGETHAGSVPAESLSP